MIRICPDAPTYLFRFRLTAFASILAFLSNRSSIPGLPRTPYKPEVGAESSYSLGASCLPLLLPAPHPAGHSGGLGACDMTASQYSPLNPLMPLQAPRDCGGTSCPTPELWVPMAQEHWFFGLVRKAPRQANTMLVKVATIYYDLNK